MKASELIEELKSAIENVGDLPVNAWSRFGSVEEVSGLVIMPMDSTKPAELILLE